MKAEEKYFVKEQDDDELPRLYWKAQACPVGGCSSQSWSRCYALSFTSEENVRKYVAAHLVGSSLHAYSEADAISSADTCEIDVLEESRDERDQYRQQTAAAKKRKIEATGKSGGKGGKMDAISTQVAELKSAVEKLTGAGASSSADDGAVAAVARPPREKLTMSRNSVELIHSSLTRAVHACEQGSVAMQGYSKQLANEGKLLSQAKDMIERAFQITRFD